MVPEIQIALLFFQMEETACIDESTQARLDIKCVKLIIGIMADIRSTQLLCSC